MAHDSHNDAFLQNLIACQDRLCAYATALVGSPAVAEDLVQQANLVIWRRAEDFEPGTDFGAWACRVLFYEVLAWRKRQARSRLVFDDAVLSMIAEQAEPICETAQTRRRALSDCLAKLTEAQRDLLNARYDSDQPLRRTPSRSAASSSSRSRPTTSEPPDCRIRRRRTR